MKSVPLTPNSSTKSSTTATSSGTSMESESRDSYYFPGCRKDANCNCEMCIESMNATLDLMPQSNYRGSMTKRSISKPTLRRSPISFNTSTLSTPKSRTETVKMSPPLNSTARICFHDKLKRKEKHFRFGVSVIRLLWGLSLILAAEFGFSWVVSGILRPELSREKVRILGEKSLVSKDLNERLSFLKKDLWGLVGKQISHYSYVGSPWKINQDGFILNSRNVLYKSLTEEVSIWGWPLQTAGLLTAEFSSRSFTILSGRVTEWTNGEVGYLIRNSNTSWVQGKWSASAVQLDPNTWILEYQQRPVIENSRLISAALHFLKFRLIRELKNVQQEFWLIFAFGKQYSGSTGQNLKIPT
ncbi:uncharacterized protein [Coffea arabica]|uniref:Uncharacterized protein isoform X1 n=1 Tax=Coffea arabica TaxID=13443 RepID=A0A6P6X323_COFAR|nr:uncharacterized protein LOC113737198 isoform X1 [Coffea arabica]